MTAEKGGGYRVDEDSDSEDDNEDDYEEEWSGKRKEKITFAAFGVIIVVLVVAIVFGVVKLVGAGGGDTKKVSQLNEQMKEDMQKSQERDDNETAEAAAEEPETVAPEYSTPEPTGSCANAGSGGSNGGTDTAGDYRNQLRLWFRNRTKRQPVTREQIPEAAIM